MVSTGCAASSWGQRPRWNMLSHQSAKIPSSASKDEIVEYVNQHIEPIHGWRSTSARLTVTGSPIPLKAMLAVEEPNHFRMVVSSGLTGNELDLGSNQDQLWFWARQMEPKAVVTCRHEEIEAVQDYLPVPFQPDWLMEVLCVIPLNADHAEMLRDPNQPHLVKLVSHVSNPQGHTVRKVSTIDLRKGEIVSHQLYDTEHRLIASAELSDYRQFPNTNARLPHEIRLHYAQQDMKMHISLNGVEVNPPHLPKEIWNIPQIAGCPVHELRREHLVPPGTAIAGRSAREKPRAVTEYELDSPSGVWLQEQKIHPPGNAAPPIGTEHSLAGNASPGQTAPGMARISLNSAETTSPAGAGRPAGSPFFEPQNMAAHSVAPPFPSGQTAPPGHSGMPIQPAGAEMPQRSAELETWAMPAGTKRSREQLIDGIPASEFEPPVARSVTN